MRMVENHYDDYHRWLRWAYEQRYGEGSWDEGRGIGRKEGMHAGFREYKNPFRLYWNEELSVGILERDSKFIGVACLVAKEVTEKESFVRKLD